MSTESPFNPSPTLEAQLLDALTSEHHSLASLAALAATTIEQLTLWLARPAIRDRVAAIESGAAWHIRFAATLHLPRAVAALNQILTSPTLIAAAFPSEAVRQQRTAPDPTTPDAAPDLAAERNTIRAAEAIRRAASSLIRLARFKPIGPTTVCTTGILPVALTPRGREHTQPTAAAPPSNPRAAAPSTTNPQPPTQTPSREAPQNTTTQIQSPPTPTIPFLPPLAQRTRHNNNHRAPRSSTNILQAAGSARAP